MESVGIIPGFRGYSAAETSSGTAAIAASIAASTRAACAGSMPVRVRVRRRPLRRLASVTPGAIRRGAGGGRRRRRGRPRRLRQAGEERLLGLGGLRRGGGEGHGDARAVSGAQALDQREAEALGERGGEAERAVERVVDLEEGADPRALRPAGGGEEREQRRLLALEDAALGGERRHPGALVLAEAEANLVLLDHGHVGVGGGLRAADQRLDGGEARLSGLGVERLQGGEPPPAGDQAVGQGVPGAGNRQGGDLDRGALAVGADRLAQGRHLGVLGGDAVAGEVVGSDGVEREVEHHAAGLARPRQRLGELHERGGAGGLGGDPGDRREMFRARNVGTAVGGRALGNGQRHGGESAAGHQAISFSRSAISSRRQLATSSRLKAA